MINAVDFKFANEVIFSMNHPKRRIDSNCNEIYVDTQPSREAGLHYFLLTWGDRKIAFQAKYTEEYFDSLDRFGKREVSIHWTLIRIGTCDMTPNKTGAYKFSSDDEQRVAANLALKALACFGLNYCRPEWNSFPIKKEITAVISDALKAHIYGGIN